jgi:hypothetical protein
MGSSDKWWPTPLDPTIAEDSNTRARLITECLLNLKDQKVNLGENLATAKQTYDLFAKNGSTLFKSLQAARRGNWKTAFGHLGLAPKGRPVGLGLSQRYLEYIYGLKPLMSDIYGGYELLKEQLTPALLVYARRRLEIDNDLQYERTDISRGLKLQYHDARERVDKIQLVGKVSDNYSRDLARAGITNPLGLAWELVPWSFAIDWATPIGSVLSAMDATHGLEFIGGYISRTGRSTVSVKAERYPTAVSGSLYWQPLQPGVSVMFRFSNVREKLTSWPAPLFYAKSPFSSSHAITALALARQLF